MMVVLLFCRFVGLFYFEVKLEVETFAWQEKTFSDNNSNKIILSKHAIVVVKFIFSAHRLSITVTRSCSAPLHIGQLSD